MRLTKETLTHEYFTLRMTKKAIAEKYGISERTIARLSQKYSVKGFKGGINNIHHPWRDKEWLETQYQAKSIRLIALENNTDESIVFNWLKKHEIQTRGTAAHFKGKPKPESQLEKMRMARSKRVGELCPNWKGGVSELKYRERQYKNRYKEMLWAKAVKERDGKCCVCGSEEKKHAHHIKPWSTCEQSRYDISNGITLCKRCHYKIHNFKNFMEV